MGMKPHSPGDLRKWWRWYEACGWNKLELARRHPECGAATWESRIIACRTRLGVKEPVSSALRKGNSKMRKVRSDTLSRAELQRMWDAYAQANYSCADAARALKLTPAAMRTRLDRARAELKVQEPPLELRERQRMEDRAATLRRELTEANRALNEAEDIRESVFKLAAQPLIPPDWLVRDPASHDVPGLPILLTSDFQWGERIDAATLGIGNEFNKDVARSRYRLLIEKTLELAFQHMPRSKYDGLLYLRGGDMISGEIHADLRETNDLQAVPALKDLVEHECWGVEQLARRFGKLHVVSVPGNHGRITPKPQSKGSIERNLDTLSAWWLETYFKNEKRVTFWTPPSGDALMPVYGYKFLLTHGDRIGSRGGEGFIGAVATITRGMKKVADYYAALGQSIDLQFVGHFHTSLELEYGFSNGSLPGYGEYARDLRMKPQPPSQWLVFAHPRHMLGARWKILLGERPRLQ